MARLAVGIAGGIIGSMFGMPQLGFLIGSVAGNLLFPPEGVDIEGPRLGDKSVSASTYGTGIPLIFGTMRLGGNMIWSTGIEEVKSKKKQGGKGGGSPTTTTYEYFASFAMSFAEGPADDVLRMWIDGKLIYDKTGSGDDISKVDLTFRFYSGNETQDPDSLIETDKGVNQTPAFRGQCYIVFELLALKDFGNRIPNITAEITFNGSTAQSTTTFDQFTTGEGGVAGSFANGTLRPDFDRGVFYFNQTSGTVGQNVLRRGNLRNFVEDKQVAYTVDDLGNDVQFMRTEVVLPNGFIVANTDSGNTQPISLIDPTSMNIVDTFGVTDSATANTKTSFIAMTEGKSSFIQVGSNRNFLLACAGASVINATVGILQADNSTLKYVWDSDTSPIQPAIDFDFNGRIVHASCPGAVGNNFGEGYVMTGNQLTSNSSENVVIYRIRLTAIAQYVTLSDAYIGISPTVAVELTPAQILPGETQIAAGGLGNMLYDQTDDTVMFTAKGVVDTNTYLIKLDPETGAVLWRTIVPIFGNYSGFNQSRITDGVLVLGASDRAIAIRTSTGELFYDQSSWSPTIDATGGSSFWNGASSTLVATNGSDIIKWSLFRGAGGGATLDTVVSVLAVKAGLTPADIDVTALATQTLPGYMVASPAPVKNILQPLTTLYFFDGVESDYVLKFSLRDSKAVSVNIPQQDLVPLDAKSGEFFREGRIQEVELPERFTITYMNKDKDYLQAAHSAKRVLGPTASMQSRNQLNLNIAAALAPDFAKQAAEKSLYASWIERSNYSMQLPWTYLALDPADVVTITLDSGTVFRARLVETDVGLGFTIDATAISEDAAQYTSNVVSDSGSSGLTNEFLSSSITKLILLCSPLLQDADDVGRSTSSLYFLMGGYGQPGWTAGSLFKSAENTEFTEEGFVVDEMAWGSSSNALGDTDTPFSTDETNTLTVFMNTGATELSSATQLEMVNGANPAALIKADNSVEIIQYRDVTVNSDGSRTLSGLLRGRRGTETQTSGHAVGDTFILLNTLDVSKLKLALGEKDLDRYYKAVTSGTRFEDALTDTKASPLNDLKPYAVVDQKAALSGSDVVLTWKRQTRIGGELQDGTDTVPLNEDSESYSIDVISGGSPTANSPYASSAETYTYTAAQQTADGFSPPVSTITVDIYQVSAQVGRGFVERVTINVE